MKEKRSLLPLQAGIIYGPVNSRRLGRSLGINLSPTGYKLCSFDCVYCHYGRTKVKTLFPEETHLPGLEEVLEAVERALQAYRDIAYITFSGNGESTLHPHFAAIATGVQRLRDELKPGVKLALLSNSTGLHFPPIREALALFDVPIMKLDAGDPGTLARINCPAPAVKLESIIEGLKGVAESSQGTLIIQSVLVEGKVSNVEGEAFEAWLSALSEIRPAQVQIYSTDRPVPEAGVDKVSPSTLQRLAGEIERRAGVQVDAYWAQA